MKRTLVLTLGALAGVIAAGCSENQSSRFPSGADQSQPLTTADSSPPPLAPFAGDLSPQNALKAGQTPGPSPTASNHAVSGMPIPPKGSQFTIMCAKISGEGHIEEADALKARLKAQIPSLQQWYVVHSDEDSTLYYGFYRYFAKDQVDVPANPSAAELVREKSDYAEASRAQADLENIKHIQAGGSIVFVDCGFVRLESPDPTAPAQWDLANTPAKDYWSLQVAAYYDNPQRKQAAVDAVRELRKEGIEAYYYHGHDISSVCVGAWPRDAIRQQDTADAGSANPDRTLLVSSQALPDNAKPNIRDPNGRPVDMVAPKLEVLDPTMQATIKKYPEHSLNGHRVGLYGADNVFVPDPSFLVVIPHPAANDALDNIGKAPGADPSSTGDPGSSSGHSEDGSVGVGADVVSPPTAQPAAGGR